MEVTDGDHPITAGLEAFTLHDERYCHLDRYPGSRVLLHHEHEGGTQPLVWVTEDAGARVVYDALGHDVRIGRRDGGFRWVTVHVTVERHSGGQVSGTCGSMVDITDRKLMETLAHG